MYAMCVIEEQTHNTCICIVLYWLRSVLSAVNAQLISLLCVAVLRELRAMSCVTPAMRISQNSTESKLHGRRSIVHCGLCDKKWQLDQSKKTKWAHLMTNHGTTSLELFQNIEYQMSALYEKKHVTGTGIITREYECISPVIDSTHAFLNVWCIQCSNIVKKCRVFEHFTSDPHSECVDDVKKWASCMDAMGRNRPGTRPHGCSTYSMNAFEALYYYITNNRSNDDDGCSTNAYTAHGNNQYMIDCRNSPVNQFTSTGDEAVSPNSKEPMLITKCSYCSCTWKTDKRKSEKWVHYVNCHGITQWQLARLSEYQTTALRIKMMTTGTGIQTREYELLSPVLFDNHLMMTVWCGSCNTSIAKSQVFGHFTTGRHSENAGDVKKWASVLDVRERNNMMNGCASVALSTFEALYYYNLEQEGKISKSGGDVCIAHVAGSVGGMKKIKRQSDVINVAMEHAARNSVGELSNHGSGYHNRDDMQHDTHVSNTVPAMDIDIIRKTDRNVNLCTVDAMTTRTHDIDANFNGEHQQSAPEHYLHGIAQMMMLSHRRHMEMSTELLRQTKQIHTSTVGFHAKEPTITIKRVVEG